jgi:protein SCO1/2
LLIPVSSSQCYGTQHKSRIEEKLGKHIPGGLTFYDETGNRVTLERIIEKPAIVSLVYFNCNHACPSLLGGLAEALHKMELDPMKDYQVLTISFDKRDTPQVAFQKKKNYLLAAGKSFPDASWKFLTGDEENIRKFTGSVGFEFNEEGEGFAHPRVLLFLSRDGRVVRYLYGVKFQPFDIRMALAEAAGEGRGFSTGKLLLFSYSYDDQENRYLFNLPRVFGTVVMFTLVALALLVMMIRHGSPDKRV